MSQEKKQLTTGPRGVLSWPYLTGKGRDYQNDGKFKLQTKVVYSAGAETDAFVAKLDALAVQGLVEVNQMVDARNQEARAWNTAAAPGKKKPILPAKTALQFALYTRDEETGDVTVPYKMPAEIKSKKGVIYPQHVRFFDASGKLVEGELPCGNGTVARVSFLPRPWLSPAGCGVRLEPKGVQVIEFQAIGAGGFASKNAEDFGFEAEEGGYVFDPADVAVEKGEAATSESDPSDPGEL